MSGVYGSGSYEDPVKSNGHPVWFKPRVQEEAPTLKLFNSLTGQKEDFVPAKDRVIKWYNCGPTVYDHAHIGHARNYLEFDILRRVLEDYFHFDLIYHINITDIDDKIILRARQNKLVEDYKNDKSNSLHTVKEQLQIWMTTYKEKLEKKKGEAVAKMTAEGNGRKIKDLDEEVKKCERLLKNFEEMKILYSSIAENLASITEEEAKGKLIDVAKDVVAAELDKILGDTITDHSVFKKHTEHFEREFMEDMKLLGIREPDVLTRVTEAIPQVISFIQRLVDKGFAYLSPSGSVYLDIAEFKKSGKNYRKLCPSKGDTTENELKESEGALSSDTSLTEKKSANDFVLWKNSKPGEPFWESPFGQGRPGWHIECSVVVNDVFGEHTIDIHSGGEDLKFPHHDNEMAQSESFLDSKQWINYFTHAGHLHIDGLKMSKSLKNFITIRQALTKFTSRQIRLLILLNEREKKMQFSDQTIDDVRSKELLFKNFFKTVNAILRRKGINSSRTFSTAIDFSQHKDEDSDYFKEVVGLTDEDRNLLEQLISSQDTVHRALLDNVDTRTAILTMVELVNTANSYINGVQSLNGFLLRKIGVYITNMFGVFGLLESKFDSLGFEDASKRESTDLIPILDIFTKFRDEIRTIALGMEGEDKIELLNICDRLRDKELIEFGIKLEDKKDSASLYKLYNPEELKREMIEKKERESLERKKKAKNKLDQLKKKLNLYETVQDFDEGTFFQKQSTVFAVDEKLMPITENGKEVTKSRLKVLLKERNKQMKIFAKLDKEAKEFQSIDEFLKSLRGQVEVLSIEVGET